MKKSKLNLTRVNMNLPTEIVEKVTKFSHALGIPVTYGYVILLNISLNKFK